ncbi:hypothetical protein GGI35DRAFT_59579 [Trichoderma velutinum]
MGTGTSFATVFGFPRHPHLRLYAMLRFFFMHAQRSTDKEREKKQGPNSFGEISCPCPWGGGGGPAFNRHKPPLRNNTQTPKKKKRLVETSNAWKGNAETGLASNLILTLPLFPVWSPKSVCVSQRVGEPRGIAEEQTASKSSRLQPCSYPTQRIQHVTSPLRAHPLWTSLL